MIRISSPTAALDLTYTARIKLNERILLLSICKRIACTTSDNCLRPAQRGEAVGRPTVSFACRSATSLAYEALTKLRGDGSMFTAIDPPETQSLKPAGAEFWHLWTVILPRRSITGRLVRGRVWRRHDGRRWQYKQFVEREKGRE